MNVRNYWLKENISIEVQEFTYYWYRSHFSSWKPFCLFGKIPSLPRLASGSSGNFIGPFLVSGYTDYGMSINWTGFFVIWQLVSGSPCGNM